MNKKNILIVCLILICIAEIVLFTFFLKNNNIDNEKSKNNINDVQEDNINNDNDDKNNEINNESEQNVMDLIYIKVNNEVLEVKLENNSSSKAFVEKLKNSDVIVKANDYSNFEKVGELGFELPTNDATITTSPGDLILYQGDKIVLYYDTNTWSFTKIGKVQNRTQKELKEILGNDDVTFTFSLLK